MPTDTRKPSDVLEKMTLSRAEKFPNDLWLFHFGDAVHLSVESPWRVLSDNSILLARDDDGQAFGMASPINAEAKVHELLVGRAVNSVEVNSVSSDLRIQFDDRLVLEVLNLSSGYESWTLNHNDGFIWVGRNT
jgi:hypothetical protein